MFGPSTTPIRSYSAKADGSDVRQLSHASGYNAESTITRDGKKIVFTSTRNGALDIFTMDADGSHVRQLTHELGYDGGPSGLTMAKRLSTARSTQKLGRRSLTIRTCTPKD